MKAVGDGTTVVIAPWGSLAKPVMPPKLMLHLVVPCTLYPYLTPCTLNSHQITVVEKRAALDEEEQDRSYVYMVRGRSLL